MGTIRLLLALAVVFTHSYGYLFTGGKLAVQLFYIISGYLMSLILLNNKTYSNLYKFYSNRLLRLFPVYWGVAILTFVYFLVNYIISEIMKPSFIFVNIQLVFVS